ncbi:MAG: MBL fold metallo-hydrolase [Clostridia bacterium]|nr:MBL fold metallo-hydrolase [Clostridia bacterium]
MKKALIILLALMLVLGFAANAAAASQPALDAAADLYELGLFRGVGSKADGQPNFDLDRSPTRGEAVTMLVRLLGQDAAAKAGSWDTPFLDVDAWVAPYVGYAYANGLTLGISATSFGGNDPVTASQYLTFILRALGYDSGGDFTWDNAWALTDSLGVTKGEYTAATGGFYRGDVAIISYRALAARLKDDTATLLDALYARGAITGPPAVMAVSFLDVGQGDCILIESQGDFLLIDGGNNEDGLLVVNFLRSQGVDELDYIIATHPHADHIGGLDTVIENFEVETVIAPQATQSTRTFEEFIDAVATAGLALTVPQSGKSYTLGRASFIIIAPNDDYGDELNNWSVGIKLINGSTSFVMCGDAEAAAEADMLETGIDISADVLKISHHGSNTSTTDAFLAAVRPRFAVISCGSGNAYGHPHPDILTRLYHAGIKLFRTDLQGSITAVSDGSGITWSIPPLSDTLASPGVIPSKPVSGAIGETPLLDLTYILNTHTLKFHHYWCRYVGSIAPANYEQSDKTRQQLIFEGYSPCQVCQP